MNTIRRATLLAIAALAAMLLAAPMASAVNADFPHGDTEADNWTGVNIEGCGPPPDIEDACDIYTDEGAPVWFQNGAWSLGCNVITRRYLWNDGSSVIYEMEGTGWAYGSPSGACFAYGFQTDLMSQGVDPEDDGTWLPEQRCAYTEAEGIELAFFTRSYANITYASTQPGELFGPMNTSQGNIEDPIEYIGDNYTEADVGTGPWRITGSYSWQTIDGEPLTENLVVEPDAEASCGWPELS